MPNDLIKVTKYSKSKTKKINKYIHKDMDIPSRVFDPLLFLFPESASRVCMKLDYVKTKRLRILKKLISNSVGNVARIHLKYN